MQLQNGQNIKRLVVNCHMIKNQLSGWFFYVDREINTLVDVYFLLADMMTPFFSNTSFAALTPLRALGKPA